jgi:ribosomal protein L7/L12
MPFCTGCGKQVEPTDRFCRSCGAPQATFNVSEDGRVVENTRSGIMADIEPLLIRGKKIDAIKLYRQLTKTGLREAKEAIDAHEQEMVRRGVLINRR